MLKHRSRLAGQLVGASMLAILAAPVVARAEAESSLTDGNTIIVTGTNEGYVATSTVSATKTDTPLKDIPQTITVVTREQIEDQAHHSIADVLRYVPGVTVGQGEANRDQITLRGQNTTADFFLDGLRDDVQYFRSLYNIEQVEVLKGPAAMVFGRGGGGGVINRVQKTPLDRPLIAGSASVNTFGGWEVAADVNQPFGGGAAGRLNAFYERIESFRDFVNGERYGINPTAAFDFGGWKLGLSYEFVHDDRVPDRGVPSVSGQPLRGHQTTFYGVPGINRTEITAHIARLRLDGELAPGLTWSTSALYGDYDKYYTNVYPNSAVRLSDNTIELDGYRDDTDRQNLIVQSNLVWDADLDGIKNKLLLGVEYMDQDTDNSRYVTPSATRPRINVDNFTYPAFVVPFPNRSRETVSNVETISAYLQDQISIGSIVDLVLGIRYDRFSIEGRDRVGNFNFARTDEVWSPRVGLIVKPQPNLSLYASYSRSFLPRSGDQFLGLAPTTQNLAPERFTNYEIGAKWDLRPDLSLTAALFQLDRTNTTAPDLNNPTVTIPTGATRTRGAELAIIGRLTPNWQISGGYSYQDAHIRGNDSIRLGQVPEHQFSLWNRYDFSPRFGAGLGVLHQSSQRAALHSPGSPATLLPAFTRVDAALFFRPTERIQLQVNIENLFDTDYFSDAHNNNNITPGAPINARLTARVKF